MESHGNIVSSLLKQFRETRESIEKMVVDLEKVSEKIIKIFPDNLQSKYTWIFEQRVKTMTETFKTLLEMRKEVTKSLKDEIEVRRRIEKDSLGEGEDFASYLDIRKIAKRVEDFQKKSKKISEKVVDIEEQKSLKINSGG